MVLYFIMLLTLTLTIEHTRRQNPEITPSPGPSSSHKGHNNLQANLDCQIVYCNLNRQAQDAGGGDLVVVGASLPAELVGEPLVLCVSSQRSSSISELRSGLAGTGIKSKAHSPKKYSTQDLLAFPLS